MPFPSQKCNRLFRIAVCVIALTAASSFASVVTAALVVSPPNIQRPRNPEVRVMIGDALAPTTFTAAKRFVVEDTSRTRLMVITAGESVDVSYMDGQYVVTTPDAVITSTLPVRVTPLRLRRVITISNFENRPAWNPKLNDNLYYGSIEVVYSPQSQKIVLVNVVGIENYVKGIAEATDDSDEEYIKALLIAARTYTLYHTQACTKYLGEPYCLNTTEDSQLYRGAGFSRRAPHVVAAARATKLQVLTYEGALIIAPYFSQSDGRTRAWSEVWAGEYPWLQSVPDPACDGKELLGHGVGMSGAGARYFASLGWDAEQILKYYYSGVEIESFTQ